MEIYGDQNQQKSSRASAGNSVSTGLEISTEIQGPQMGSWMAKATATLSKVICKSMDLAEIVLGLRKLEWSAGVMVNSSFKAWRSNRSWQIHKNVVMEQNQGIPNTPKCILTPGVNFLRIPPDIIICQDLETLQVVKCLVWIGMIHGSWFTLLYFLMQVSPHHFALGLRYIWAYSIPIILTSNTV